MTLDKRLNESDHVMIALSGRKNRLQLFWTNIFRSPSFRCEMSIITKYVREKKCIDCKWNRLNSKFRVRKISITAPHLKRKCSQLWVCLKTGNWSNYILETEIYKSIFVVIVSCLTGENAKQIVLLVNDDQTNKLSIIWKGWVNDILKQNGSKSCVSFESNSVEKFETKSNHSLISMPVKALFHLKQK